LRIHTQLFRVYEVASTSLLIVLLIATLGFMKQLNIITIPDIILGEYLLIIFYTFKYKNSTSEYLIQGDIPKVVSLTCLMGYFCGPGRKGANSYACVCKPLTGRNFLGMEGF